VLWAFDTVGWVIWPVLKTHPRYDLKCVWWDVKPCSVYLSTFIHTLLCVCVNSIVHQHAETARLSGFQLSASQTLTKLLPVGDISCTWTFNTVDSFFQQLLLTAWLWSHVLGQQSDSCTLLFPHGRSTWALLCYLCNDMQRFVMRFIVLCNFS